MLTSRFGGFVYSRVFGRPCKSEVVRLDVRRFGIINAAVRVVIDRGAYVDRSSAVLDY